VADVVWVAATNHPENMDAAALRGGRFTEKIEFALPDAPVIAEFVRKWMEGSRARFDGAVTPAAVAEILAGLSIANVSAVLQQAVDLMVERRVTRDEHDANTTLGDIVAARSSVADLV
jgi:transitional endoplasmic reticulum ATPase